MEHNPHNLKEELLRKIKAREVSMRPHLYFTLRVAAVAVVSLFVLIFTIFIFNFLAFTVRLNSSGVLLSFGPRGFLAFLRYFPWEILILDALLVYLLQHLLRQFSFGYRIPVLYLLGGIALISGVLGYAVDKTTPLNERLLQGAEEKRLPGPVGEFYGKARRPPPIGEGVCHCIIVELDDDTFSVRDARGTSTLSVILPDDLPRSPSIFSVGDLVFIAGDRDGDTIRAFGIRKLDSRKGPPPAPRPY